MATKGAYTHILSGALSEYVSDQTSKPVEDQNQIQEELALLRASAAKAVELFNAAVEKGDDKNTFIAGQMMKKELIAVSNMARTAASIQATSTDQMTRAAVELIITSIIEIVFGALRVEPNGLEIAGRIEKEIRKKVDLNADMGTVSLPSDDLVKLMDSSIGRPDLVVDAAE